VILCFSRGKSGPSDQGFLRAAVVFSTKRMASKLWNAFSANRD